MPIFFEVLTKPVPAQPAIPLRYGNTFTFQYTKMEFYLTHPETIPHGRLTYNYHQRRQFSCQAGVPSPGSHPTNPLYWLPLAVVQAGLSFGQETIWRQEHKPNLPGMMVIGATAKVFFISIHGVPSAGNPPTGWLAEESREMLEGRLADEYTNIMEIERGRVGREASAIMVQLHEHPCWIQMPLDRPYYKPEFDQIDKKHVFSNVARWEAM